MHFATKNNFSSGDKQTLKSLFQSIVYALDLLTLDDLSNRTRLNIHKMEYNSLFPEDQITHYQMGGQAYEKKYEKKYNKYKNKYLELKKQILET